MHIVWEKGSATVKDVVDALPKEFDLAYTTVLTTMQNLEKKGVIRHEEQGRAYLYYPILKQREARRSAVQYVVKKFFDNSLELLVLNILENEDLEPEELQKLKKLLDESE
ncbi:BlaI/MecI/CopY family transcriptional regulator [Candidatus Acetothermia bacterium]|nr:BlaI/MecI/CopY family transcriptional regulator [Candidatus Acetothermia bacterium]MBI3644094.1 BlaI/MecI/CopY family transcriptional regulator [Candidatus Acetothermia bacterium]